MQRGDALSGAINSYNYTVVVSAKRSSEQFTPRIIPYHENGLVPMESAEILWYR
jgi:starch phosphorylase